MNKEEHAFFFIVASPHKGQTVFTHDLIPKQQRRAGVVAYLYFVYMIF